MIRSLHIRGYRSLRDFRQKFDRVTVVTGANGVGKSNVYRALALLQRMAEGNFAKAVADEGGLPSMLWAGNRLKSEPIRLRWEVELDDLHLEMECGMIPTAPGDPTAFRTDPDMKLETLRAGGTSGRVMARRKGPAVELRAPDGQMVTSPLPLHVPESMLSEIRDGIRYPALMAAREILLAGRFYHHFTTEPHSSLRQPQIGFWSPVLAADGGNLAAALQTLVESRKSGPLDDAVAMAFPGCEWRPVDDDGRFQLQLRRPDLKRWLNASELSDGTLRFFCLCAALLTPKPPPWMVCNEPETSLHPSLLPSLAELIARASVDTQLIIVTHSREFATGIAERCPAKVVDLVSYEDETRPATQATGKRVWEFEE